MSVGNRFLCVPDVVNGLSEASLLHEWQVLHECADYQARLSLLFLQTVFDKFVNKETNCHGFIVGCLDHWIGCLLHRPDPESALELLVLNSDNRLLLSCWGDALEPTIDKEIEGRKEGAIKHIRHVFGKDNPNLTDEEVEDIYNNGRPEGIAHPRYWSWKPRYMRSSQHTPSVYEEC